VAEQARNERWQFTGHDYTPVDLYGIVYEVALLATRPGHDPRRVPQAKWNEALAGSPWPNAPEAKEMCVQLADPKGTPWAWRALLQDVFSGKSLERIHTARMSAEDDPLIDEAIVYHAVRRVATFRGQTTLLPDEYRVGREAMIAEHRHKWKYPSTIERLLPTLHQLLTAAQGDWTLVLRWADLEELPTQQERRPRSRSYLEAIISFWEETSVPPRHKWLAAYAGDKQFSLGRRPRGPQEQIVEQARQVARERGLEMPAFDPNAKRPLWTAEVDRRDHEAEPRERLTNVTAVTALREFLEHCSAQAPKQHAALNYYRALQQDKKGRFRHWPAASQLQKRGPWRKQLDEAVHPDALERAAAEDLALLQTRRERAAQPQKGSPDSPRALKVLELLREQSPRTRAELQERVGGTKSPLTRDLRALVKAGLIRKIAGGRSSAYVICD
jgi:DNA-binding transcriptional ArsR family regulator